MAVKNKEYTLFVSNYSMDENNPTFSHQFESVVALASEYKKVIVLTREFQINNLDNVPSNIIVNVRTWKKNSKIINSAKWFFYLFQIFRREKIFCAFFHMTEVESVFALPIMKLLRIPSCLWYAHKSNSLGLKIFHKFGNLVLTSTSGSCPINGVKVRAIGQGINTEKFYSPPREISQRNKFICIGRVDESKRIELVINVLAKIKLSHRDLELTIIGRSSSEKYRDKILNLVKDCNTSYESNWIKFSSEIPRNQIPKLFFSSDVLIHAYNGSLDKVLLEASLAGLPVITTNYEFNREFNTSQGLNLYQNLVDFFRTPEIEIHSEIRKIQRVIISKHSLKTWSKSIAENLNSLN